MHETADTAVESLRGRAADVPYAAFAPRGGPRPGAPVVLAWHLMDPPRSESAFATSVPLHGLDAWRIYLGLPLSGSRLPAGGVDEVMRLGYEDAVLNLLGPAAVGAAGEFGAAFLALRERLELEPGPIGVMGGSIGAAVAQLVMAEGDLAVAAAVLISPVVQLRRAVEANERRYGVTYAWSGASEAVAERLDFVARADELSRRSRPAVLVMVGEQDDRAFHESGAELVEALSVPAHAGAEAELVSIPDMAHTLAEEPGTEPAPQEPHAAAVDRRAVEWFRRHLTVR